MRFFALSSHQSHFLAFMFGLSLSLFLTFCANEGASEGEQEPSTEELETRLAAVEEKMAAVEAVVATATVSKSQFIETTGLTPINTADWVEWTLSEIQAQSSGESILEISDDSGNTRTVFTALMPCRVLVTYVTGPSAGNAPQIRLNDSVSYQADGALNNGERTDATFPLVLETGDTLFVGSTGDFATPYLLTIVATAEFPLSLN